MIPEKVDLINIRKSPIQDENIEKYVVEKPLDLTATLDGEVAYKNADFVIIATYGNLYPSRIILGYPNAVKGYDEENEVNMRGIVSTWKKGTSLC